MKKNIHPKWYPDAKVTCTCGHTFTTGSTQPEIRVEICSACHPFFTGEEKYIDTAGRVEKFKKKQEMAEGTLSKKAKKLKKLKEQERKRREEEKRPKSFKEMRKLLKKTV